MKTILAIESSCDETSAAVVRDSTILSNVVSSQYFHKKYGGVVPELASRAHLQAISFIVKEALNQANLKIEQIDALAVTREPGLVGSLIVGANFAKALALRYNLPIIPVNHIEGHLFSGCLQDGTAEFPFISLVVSGGHTALFYVESYTKYSILGLTKDDAAGEAFDKIATMLGLAYPGGPMIDKFSQNGEPARFDFPRSMLKEKNYNFSFSGLKTSVRYFIAKNYPNGIPEELIPDFAASVQEAIVDVLVAKTVKAAKEYKSKTILISGGVSANSRLRAKMKDVAGEKIKVIAPEIILCMDNAAMIGFIGEKKFQSSEDFNDLKFTVNSNALRAKR